MVWNFTVPEYNRVEFLLFNETVPDVRALTGSTQLRDLHLWVGSGRSHNPRTLFSSTVASDLRRRLSSADDRKQRADRAGDHRQHFGEAPDRRHRGSR